MMTRSARRTAGALTLVLALALAGAAAPALGENDEAESGAKIYSAMILDGVVQEARRPVRVEISLSNRSGEWVELGEAAKLSSHLRLITAGGKAIAPEGPERFAASKSSQIGPGGFVGVALDAQSLFPQLATPGRYTLRFEPPGAEAREIALQVIEPYDDSKDYWLSLETPEGEVTIDLDEKNAPASVSYVVRNVRLGYFDGASIPRLQPGLAMRVTPTTRPAPATIPFERTTSQLLAGSVILEPVSDGRRVASTPNLILLLGAQAAQQGAASAVGQVTGGLDVLEKLARRPTSGAEGDPPWQPRAPVSIERARVIEK